MKVMVVKLTSVGLVALVFTCLLESRSIIDYCVCCCQWTGNAVLDFTGVPDSALWTAGPCYTGWASFAGCCQSCGSAVWHWITRDFWVYESSLITHLLSGITVSICPVTFPQWGFLEWVFCLSWRWRCVKDIIDTRSLIPYPYIYFSSIYLLYSPSLCPVNTAGYVVLNPTCTLQH